MSHRRGCHCIITMFLSCREWMDYWRYNERNGVSNYRRLDCLLNRLFWCRYEKKHESYASLPLWGEFTGEWIHHTKGQWRGKKFPFDDVIMICSNVIYIDIRWLSGTHTLLPFWLPLWGASLLLLHIRSIHSHTLETPIQTRKGESKSTPRFYDNAVIWPQQYSK